MRIKLYKAKLQQGWLLLFPSLCRTHYRQCNYAVENWLLCGATSHRSTVLKTNGKRSV